MTTEETGAAVTRLETKIAARRAQLEAAKAAAAEAALDGADGTAHWHDVPDLEREIATLTDGLALARQRHLEAQQAEADAQRAVARAEADAAAKVEFAAWAEVQGAIMRLNDCWLDAVAAADARSAALSRAGLKPTDAFRRRRGAELLGAFWALSPDMAKQLNLSTVPMHMRQPLDVVMGKALGVAK